MILPLSSLFSYKSSPFHYILIKAIIAIRLSGAGYVSGLGF